MRLPASFWRSITQSGANLGERTSIGFQAGQSQDGRSGCTLTTRELAVAWKACESSAGAWCKQSACLPEERGSEVSQSVSSKLAVLELFQ